MGYDCTLHVIDERLIREQFAPRLLGALDAPTPFDAHPDAADLWSQVRTSLHEDDPAIAANRVCQLAIAFCAAQLPYHYERGFCLSLWPDQAEALAAQVPQNLVGDPATLFEGVVAKHPALRGQFPQSIESNYCPGLFVPAQNVPDLLAWARQRVQRCPKPDQRLFRGLLLVLEEAAARGLAYWEGTDLPVEMRTIRPAQPSGVADEHPLPDGYSRHVNTLGDVIAISSGPGKDCWTALVDLSTWPPKVEVLPEFSLGVARSPAGRLLTVSSTRDENYRYRARVRTGSWTAPPAVLPLDGPPEQLGLSNGGFVGERILAFREFEKQHNLPGIPLVESEPAGRLVPLPGDHQSAPPSQGGVDDCPGMIRLNDAADVVIWKGQGYELRDGHLKLTFPDLGRTEGLTFHGASWDQDGFFYVGEDADRHRRLFHVRRGHPPQPHLERVGNIMFVEPGPGRSLLLKQGDNKKGDLGVLYFPDDDALIRLEPELFPDQDPGDIHTLHWAPAPHRLVATTPHRLWSIPFTNVLERPKYRASTGRQIKA